MINDKRCIIGMRNFYIESNRPSWFPDNVVFRRPNHPKGMPKYVTILNPKHGMYL